MEKILTDSELDFVLRRIRDTLNAFSIPTDDLGCIEDSLRQARQERDALKNKLQNDAANKMPTSFVKMSWACGHTTGAVCDICATEWRKERDGFELSFRKEAQDNADFAVADEERELRHREQVATLTRQLKDESDEAAACHVAIGLLKSENERAKQNEATMRQVLGIKTEEVDELRLQNKILSANREADEKDIVGLKAENERLRKAIDTHWYVETEDGTKCFYCGEEVIDEDENYKPKHPEVPDLLGAVVCIVLKCQPKVTQVNLDTDSTIDESGGRKGDETIEAAGKT